MMGDPFDPFDLVLDAAFRTLGVDGTYTPAGGAVQDPVRFLTATPDTELGGFGNTRHRGQSSVFEARVSQLSAAARGDSMSVGGVAYTVTDADRRDGDRKIWTLECVVGG